MGRRRSPTTRPRPSSAEFAEGLGPGRASSLRGECKDVRAGRRPVAGGQGSTATPERLRRRRGPSQQRDHAYERGRRPIDNTKKKRGPAGPPTHDRHPTLHFGVARRRRPGTPRRSPSAAAQPLVDPSRLGPASWTSAPAAGVVPLSVLFVVLGGSRLGA